MSTGAAIEDIYPLAPMQEGMLFHSVYAPEVEVYFQQIHGEMYGVFNSQLFRQAWDAVLERHPVLRTAFYWENLDAPMQVVMRDCRMPWTELDWRAYAPEKIEAEFESLLLNDRAQGFKLATAPLTRFGLVRVAQDRYRFVWSFHHIILDGWSTSIVLADLLEIYQALTDGRNYAKARPLQFKSYVEYVKQCDAEAAADFWRMYLEGLEHASSLRLDRAESGAAQAEVHAEYEQTLNEKLSRGLEALSRKLGVTLNAVAQAAWALVLALESGRDDIMFGATVSGRPAELENVEEIVGLLINTLPVRKKIDWNTSVAELIRAFAADHARKDAYAQTPLSDIAGHSPLGRGADLFDTLLVFENYPSMITEDPRRELQFENLSDFERTNFALTILLIPDTELQLRWLYDGARLDLASVQRLAAMFKHLLETLQRSPERALKRLALLDRAAVRDLRHAERGPVVEPQHHNLIELLDEACEKFGGRPALIYGTQNISYADLQLQSRQYAAVLRRPGLVSQTDGSERRIGRGDVVGIQMRRSAHSAIVLLAILRCGAAYVALDPQYPAERRAMMMANANLSLVIVDSPDSGPAAAMTVKVLTLQQLEQAAQQLNAAEMTSQAAIEQTIVAEDAAYLMFTSGSSGRPKGIIHEHRALVNLIEWQISAPGFAKGLRSAQLSSYSFDVSFQELFATWAGGGALHVINEEVKRDPQLLMQTVLSAKIERLTLPYVALRALAGYFLEVEQEADRVPDAEDSAYVLREIVTSGEQLIADAAIKRWVQSMGAQLRNQYGPTETHVCTEYLLPANVNSWPELPAIGTAINNGECYVLDRELRRVPPGVIGELYLAGRFLARGYHALPGQSAASFLPNPFARAGERMYRTGDLARWTDAGVLEFMGRADSQLKIRGYRVEVAEIELLLQEHPSIKQAAVVLRKNDAGEALTAFVVAQAGNLIEASVLRAFLTIHLPDYMLPAVYVVRDQLPRTSSGKLHRRMLETEALEQVTDGFDATAPRTPTEEVILGIWRQLLGNARLGIHSDFFEAGGHSLLATRLVARLRPIFQIEIPVRLVFEAPTVARLSAALAELDKTGNLAEIPKRDPNQTLVLAPAQVRLWFIELLQGATPQYNLPAAVKLRGELDVKSLKKALEHIVAQHAILRCKIENENGRPQPRTAELAEFTVDTRSISAELFNSTVELQEEVAKLAWQTFDLQSQLPIRCWILRASEAEHVLVLSLHHIVFDGWSQSVLVEQLAENYTKILSDAPLADRRMALDYLDMAAWWQSPAGKASVTHDLDYWRAVFADEVAPLQLPADNERPEVRKYRGATFRIEFDTETTAALHRLARRQNSSLYMLLLSAYVFLLSRHADADDLVVATPVANRRRPELENIIGFFVNTLPLRFSIDHSSTFAKLLQHVRSVVLDAFNHQDAPFDKIVEEVQTGRDLGTTPLAQTSFILQNTPEPVLNLPGVETEVVDLYAPNVKHEIDLSFVELAAKSDAEAASAATSLLGAFDYDRDVFSEAEISLLARRFEKIVALMLQDTSIPLKQVELLTSQDQLLLNLRKALRPSTRTLTPDALLEQFALSAPQAPAIQIPGLTVTYAEFNKVTNRFAGFLAAQGCRVGDRLMLLLETSGEFAALLFAALKSGVTFVPLDPGSPAARIALIAEECRPKILIHSQAQDLPGLSCPQISLKQLKHVCQDYSPKNPPQQNSLSQNQLAGYPPELPAYCIFTSGSTGKPKGVEVSRYALAIAMLEFCKSCGLNDNSRLLAYIGPAFDAMLLSNVAPVVVGACICYGDSGRNINISGVRRDVQSLHPTQVFTSSALYATLLESGLTLQRPPVSVIIGGDVLQPATLELHRDQLPGVRLYNGYGPTEAAVLVSQAEVTSEALSIGRPLSHVQMYVVDDNAGIQLPGVPGELYLSGPMLAQGYVNNSGQTAAVFVPDPWSDIAGARMYRTGDVVRRRMDGSLEFIGRIDTQVKIRGVRVEPGELEQLLMRHPQVLRAYVIVKGSSQKSLHVFCTLKETDQGDRSGSEQVLAAYLTSRLPEYLQPSTLLILDEFPLNTNAKIDVNQLHKLISGPSGANAAASQLPEVQFIQAAPGIEAEIAAVWRELLDGAPIGRQSDFFRSGGHSLLAVRMGARLAEDYGLEPPVELIFRAAVLREYAAAYANLLAEHRNNPPEQETQLCAREHLPERRLSFAQERLWFLDQLEGGGRVYLMPMMLRIRGELQVAELERALNILIERHEQLRSTFPAIKGQARQIAHANVRLPIQEIKRDHDLTLDHQLQREALHEVESDLNLQSEIPIRARLLNCATDDKVLIVTLHHIVADGWSMAILAEELGAILRGQDLAEIGISYADFAVWQREETLRGRDDRQLDYWRNKLADAPEALDLPTDKPRPAHSSHRGAVFNWQIDAEQSAALRDLCAEQGLTLSMALSGLWAVFLARFCGTDDITIGMPVANRRPAITEKIVGLYLNTIVLRVRAQPTASLRELFAQVRETSLEALANQDVPFERVVEAVHPSRSLSRTPLFQVMFVMHNMPEVALERQGLKIESLEMPAGGARFDLTLACRDTAAGISCSIEYALDLFGEASVKRMAQIFSGLLDAACTQNSMPLAALPLHSYSDSGAEVITAPAARFRGGVHAFFEAWAQRDADKAAIRFEGKTYRYAQINALANRIARALHETGTGLENVIGICAERSPEMVAAIFGILKTGAAFLPLEPGLPTERLAGMLADANADLIICDAAGQSALAGTTCRSMLLDSIKPQDFDSTSFPTPPLSRDSAAYIVFTSGSTGRPKGAVNTHAALWNRLAWMEDYLDMGPLDRILHKTPISFDVSVWELLLPLCSGATQVIARPDGHRDAVYLADLIKSETVTILHFVPPMLRAFLEEAEPQQLARLRHIVCSGEALPPDLVDICRGQCPAEIHNLYGPTEAAIDVSSWRTTVQQERSIPIGHAIDGVELLVLDAFMQPLPPGVPGELYIGGVALARCYVAKPALTAEAFVPHPTEPGTRLYRTGDVTRRRADGAIEFVGRRDHQIKLRGFRIELGEIEQQSRKLHWVRNSVAVVRERSVILYVETDSTRQAANDSELIMEHLRSILPEYMLPQDILLLTKLPLTANGKIDRRALPQVQRRADEVPYVAPRSEQEAVLADIWAEVLGRERVGIHDNYFALGGDSILSIQILARARQAGLHLSIRNMFERQTVAELAVLAGRAGIVQAEQGRVHGSANPTAIQEWFFEQDLASPEHFNQSLMFQVPIDFDADRALQILNILAEHHDALRTRFIRNADTWQQMWSEDSEPQVLWKSAQILSVEPAVQQQRLASYCSKLQASLDLEHGPVFAGAYFKMAGSSPGRLLLLAHHLVIDGVSWRILLEDFVKLYRSSGSLTGVELPSKSTAYRDWAHAQRHWAEPQASQISDPNAEENADKGNIPAAKEAIAPETVRYWQAQSRIITQRLPLSADVQALADPDSLNLNDHAREVDLVLVPELARAVSETVAGLKGVSTDDVLLTAVSRVLARQATETAGRKAVRIDVEGHGRESAMSSMDLSRTVGWFTTIMPIVISYDQDEDTLRDIKTVKQALRGAPQGAGAYAALRYLAEEAELRASLEPATPADLLYNNHGNVLSAKDGFLQAAPERGGPMYAPQNRRSHRLEINAITQDGKIAIVLRYATKLYDAEFIDALCSSFRDELAALLAKLREVKHPIQTPADFPLVNLRQSEVDELTSGRTVQDILPITAAQRGMFVQTLIATDRKLHIEQHVYTLTAMRDPQVLFKAWERTLQRHESLRAAFVWSTHHGPLQIIEKDIALPWRHANLVVNKNSAQADAEYRDAERRRLIERELQQTFDLERPPLLRLLYIDEGEGRATLVWTHHHILLDGWSVGLILREILLTIGQEILSAPRPAPLRNYMQWLNSRSQDHAANWWRQTFTDVRVPTPLGKSDEHQLGAVQEFGFAYLDRSWGSDDSRKLRELAREARTTTASYVHAAWAIVLAANSGASNVVFGATASGRPVELPGTEEMTGMFINTLPVVVRLQGIKATEPPEGSADEHNASNGSNSIGETANENVNENGKRVNSTAPSLSVKQLIGDLHAAALERRDFEWTSAGQVHEWIDVSGVEALFDSLLVFENLPAHSSEAQAAGLELTDFQARGAQTAHMVTLMLAESDLLHMRIVYQRERLGPQSAELLLLQLQTALKLLTQSQTQTLDTIIAEVKMLGVPRIWPATGQSQSSTPLADELAGQLAEQLTDREAGSVAGHQAGPPAEVAVALKESRRRPVFDDEKVLFEIWAEILQDQDFGIDDNFFDLGGSSLLAVRMLQAVNRRFKSDVAPADLLRAGNIAAMAELLQSGVRAEWSALVRLAESPGAAKLFLVHPAGGNVMCYHDLAQSLKGDVKVYGLQAFGLRRGQSALESVAAMAGQYLDEIQREIGRQKFYLAGWSFGGAVAQEMAVQAKERGLEVAKVFIIDSYPTSTGDEFKPADEAEFLAAIVKDHFAVDPAQLRAHKTNMLQFLLDSMHAAGALDPAVGRADAERIIDVFRRNSSMQHQARYYADELIVLRAAQHPAGFEGGELLQRWQALAKQVRDVVIGGTHDSIVYPPHVERLSDVILAEINNARL